MSKPSSKLQSKVPGMRISIPANFTHLGDIVVNRTSIKKRPFLSKSIKPKQSKRRY